MNNGSRYVAMSLAPVLAMVPLACAGDDDSASASQTDPTDTSVEESGSSQAASTETTAFEISDDLSFTVPDDWQSLGAGLVGSEEFIARQANVSVRGPNARRETYGESVAEGDDFATVAAAEAQMVAGASAAPDIDGSIATVEGDVGDAGAMVVVVDLGNGEYASIFVSAAGENPIPEETKQAVKDVASTMKAG